MGIKPLWYIISLKNISQIYSNLVLSTDEYCYLCDISDVDFDNCVLPMPLPFKTVLFTASPESKLGQITTQVKLRKLSHRKVVT